MCSNITVKASHARNRRVIFPVLHQPASPTEQHESSSPASNKHAGSLRKVPSLNSLGDLETKYDETLWSPPFNKSIATVIDEPSTSPNCVSSVSPQALPLIPSLPPTSPDLFKPLPSSMLIPPFKPSVTPPKGPKNPKKPCPHSPFGSPLYKKRIASPHICSTRPAVIPSTSSPRTLSHLPESILRNRSNESVPSMVSATTSEGSCDARRVRFDARVCVFEFFRHPREHRLTWFSPSEMEKFRRNAVELVCAQAREWVPTGTGRLVRKRNNCSHALFTNARLTTDENEDELALQNLARRELYNILIIDPHDLCAKLFAKALQQMLPCSNVVTAKTSYEAMNRIHQLDKATNFDLILVEERLKLIPDCTDHESSGSALIRLLRTEFASMVPDDQQPILIGVSAHYGADKDALKQSGATFCWPKPPPALDKVMRDNLLKHILILRGKEETALRYFL